MRIVVVKFALAFVGGALVTLIVLLPAMPPRPDDMERAAGELIPADADVERLGAAGGHPVIVGWDQFANGEFTVDRPWSEVGAEMDARAQELGWQVADVRTLEAGAVIELWRPLSVGRITVGENSRLTAPPDTTYGTVSVNRNEDVRTPLQWGLVVLGGLAAAVLTRRWA